MSLLEDELQDIEEDALDAKAQVDAANGSEPLPTTERNACAAELNSMLSHVSTALGIVNNTGSVSDRAAPNNLTDMAQEVANWALAARYASSHDSIGTALKTIQHWVEMENGYRDLAGIT